jgi:lipoprotein NlpI
MGRIRWRGRAAALARIAGRFPAIALAVLAAAGALPCRAQAQALAVAEHPFEPIYRRGQARFYEGRFAQAAADFAKAVEHEKDAAARPCKQLWHAFALRRQGLPLPAAMQQPDNADAPWPRPALAMLAGRLSAEALIDGLGKQLLGDERELALAEAWFYVGQHHLAEGRRDAARAAFEAAQAKGITMYVEHVAARFELQRLAP